ncbi:MAG TPA: peptidylprolyl isomerase [bacterium]|jgi:parvulin-like peptidyl-prolyl isomerase|nr:peptidylprolyl isomerase [bacterium]
MPRAFALTLILAFALSPAFLAGSPRVAIAARVGDDIITTADIDDAVQSVAQDMSPDELASPEGKKKLADARKNVLDHMIEVKLVLLAANDGPEGFADAAKDNKSVKNPYLPDDSEIETEMEKLFDQTRQRFPDQDAFEAALSSEHISVPEYRNQLRERVRDEMTYERMEKIKEQEFRPSLHVTDAEAQAFYDQNKADFFQGAEVNLRHILFAADDEAGAKRLLAVLKAKKPSEQKAAFIDLARKHSADAPTKDQGGELGWIEKGQSWPELEAVAFAAKDNSLAGPVKTQAGWHILYVEGHRPGKQLAFEDIKKDVTNQVYQEKVQKRLSEWIDELKTKYYVERQGDTPQ